MLRENHGGDAGITRSTHHYPRGRIPCNMVMDRFGCPDFFLSFFQVLLYDPLYSWSLSPEKKVALQAMNEPDISDTAMTTGIPTSSFLETSTDGCSSDTGNKMAERALLRLRQKLNGVEENVQLSVCGQVNHLIREAMDPNNLCKLFPGWQPWL